MQKITHLAAGIAVAQWLGLDPVYTAFGALLPDIDYICCHRKLLHNVFVLVISLLHSFDLFAGVVSHIALDMLTVSGVALLYPLSERRFRIAKFRTGGLLDWLLFLIFVVYVSLQIIE